MGIIITLMIVYSILLSNNGIVCQYHHIVNNLKRVIKNLKELLRIEKFLQRKP